MPKKASGFQQCRNASDESCCRCSTILNRNAASSTPPTTAPLSIGEIAQRIHLIRGQRVVLNSDLASFYGETTKRFNQQVRRYLARFPADFMFQLAAEEATSLRLQSATLDATGVDSKSGRGRYSKYLPMAFTKHGAIMAATLLNSPRATELSVYVVRAFIELRGILASNRELAGKVNTLERKVFRHERHIAELVDSMSELLAAPRPPPKRSIGFITPGDKPQCSNNTITVAKAIRGSKVN